MRMLKNDVVVSELVRLAEQNGGELQASAVVDAARPEESPLHSHFEWDDSLAGDQWRLQQARQLISVVVRYESVGNDRTVPCRVFVSLTPDRQQEGGGYRLAARVLGDETRRQQLLADALQELERVKTKYADLQELAEVFAAIDRVDVPLSAA